MVYREDGLMGQAGRRGQSAVVVLRDRFGERIGVWSRPVCGDHGENPTIDMFGRTVIEPGRISGGILEVR